MFTNRLFNLFVATALVAVGTLAIQDVSRPATITPNTGDTPHKAQSVPEAGAQGIANYVRAHSNSSAQVVPDASVQSVADYIRLHSNDLSFREYQLGERYGVTPQQYYRNKFLDECSDAGFMYRAQCLKESQKSTP